MSEPERLAYLDHNILDRMVKGDLEVICAFLKKASLVPVYSNENLAEIRRSKGFEDKFLDVFRKIGARYLVPEMNAKFHHTGGANLRMVDPAEAYAAYVETVDSSPGGDLDMTGMLEKFYGGRSDQTFVQIAQDQADGLRSLLDGLKSELASIPEFSDMNMSAVLGDIDLGVMDQYAAMAAELDGHSGAAVRQFEEFTGIGPKQLNNIKPPEVIQQVWNLLQPRLPACGIDLEMFFGIRPYPFEADAGRARTSLEKVNAIYHQLNFVGYFRDSKMHQQRRFIASSSDMTHAGLATFCHVLLCGDRAMAKKAAAAYGYLGLGTQVLILESASDTA